MLNQPEQRVYEPELVHSFPGLRNDAIHTMIFFFEGEGGLVSPSVVKAYSDFSEEVTVSLFRVTRTVCGGC